MLVDNSAALFVSMQVYAANYNASVVSSFRDFQMRVSELYFSLDPVIAIVKIVMHVSMKTRVRYQHMKFEKIP